MKKQLVPWNKKNVVQVRVLKNWCNVLVVRQAFTQVTRNFFINVLTYDDRCLQVVTDYDPIVDRMLFKKSYILLLAINYDLQYTASCFKSYKQHLDSYTLTVLPCP